MTDTVSPISLGAIAGVHDGTGTFSDSKWLVTPSSVPLPGPLAFHGAWVTVTTLLFEIADKVVPNWFGVALPSGIADFTKPHIFFHPTPAQARGAGGSQLYPDSQYQGKGAHWPELFYYMERLGYQLDGAARNQIIIMPFLTEAAKDTGIFAAYWQDIVTSILTQLRSLYRPADHTPLTLTEIAVSSFSAGIVYSDAFRRHAPGLAPLLGEVWDFDGHISSYTSLSQALIATAGCRVIQYDQVVSNDSSRFHVPIARWADWAQPPKTAGEVHGLIRDFMFMHGASISEVGSPIASPDSGTTGTATHSASGSATQSGSGGTSTQSASGSATQNGTSTAATMSSGSATATASASGSTSVGPALPAAPVGPAVPVGPAGQVPRAVPRAPAVPAGQAVGPLLASPQMPAVPFRPLLTAPQPGRIPVTLSSPGARMPHPAMPTPVPAADSAQVIGRCGYAQAVASIVANAALTAQTATTGISAIAAHRRQTR